MSVLLTEREGAVLTLTLNRPKAYNAFTRELALALQSALEEAASDASIRAVVLTGNGKAFCAGQDLSELVGDDAIDISVILKEHFNPVVQKIRDLPKPVIAAVQGVAAGAGANIAIACDVVLAHEQASFIQAFTKIGLIPDSGGTWMLPRVVGYQKASALMLTGDKLSAQEAERLGMVYRVLPEGEFAAAVHELAHRLANMPTRALALAKEALNDGVHNSFSQQLAREDELQGIAARTADYAEGVEAFLAKRKPTFRGA